MLLRKLIMVSLLFAVRLPAQRILGRVVDITGRPVSNALVVVLDSAGRVVGRSGTTPSGEFGAPVAGSPPYRIHVIAIGFAPSDTLAVPTTRTVTRIPAVVMQRTAVHLQDLVSRSGQAHCSVATANDSLVPPLLDAAVRALRVMEARVAASDSHFVERVIRQRRLLAATGTFTVADTAEALLAVWPVRSLDPDTLRIKGFSRPASGIPGDVAWFGPDAAVLLADWFRERHCFTISAGKAADSGAIHLHFAPLAKGKLVDVEGDLTLDASDLSLRALTFSLVRIPYWARPGSVGGEINFRKEPDGQWTIGSWSMRAPLIGRLPGAGENLVQRGTMLIRGDITRVN